MNLREIPFRFDPKLNVTFCINLFSASPFFLNNLFSATPFFLHPLESPGNLWFSDVSLGIESEWHQID